MIYENKSWILIIRENYIPQKFVVYGIYGKAHVQVYS